MKKAYIKPQIVFDSFQLSQNIAGDCEFISTFARGNCAILEPETGDIVYLDSTTCQFTPPNANDGICYHVPTEDWNVYSS